MENTVAFGYLMQLIEVIGSLFTTQFLFGFSILNLITIAFLFNAVIGVMLGGIEPRAKNPSDTAYQRANTSQPLKPFSAGVREIPPTNGAKETYIGYGRY